MRRQPHLQRSKHDAPFRQATATRPSASGPGDRIASGRDVAIYFREDCRTLRDSLQLEMVVAQYCLRIRDVLTTEDVPVGDAVGLRVVAELEHEGDELSHSILRGTAHVGVGLMAEHASAAAARLAEQGVGLPKRFPDVGEAKAIGVWRAEEGGLEGEYALFADYEFPQGAGHSIALYVEPRRGGLVKHIGLLAPMSEIGLDGPFHPDAMDPISIPDGGALIAELLERTHGPLAQETDDFRVLIARARAREMQAVSSGPSSRRGRTR